jgi:hypothetical protein
LETDPSDVTNAPGDGENVALHGAATISDAVVLELYSTA